MPGLRRGESSELPVARAGTEELMADKTATCFLRCLSAGDTCPEGSSPRRCQCSPSFFQHQTGAAISVALCDGCLIINHLPTRKAFCTSQLALLSVGGIHSTCCVFSLILEVFHWEKGKPQRTNSLKCPLPSQLQGR